MFPMADPSSPQPTSEYLEELIAGYVFQTLSSEELKAFEHLLQENPSLSLEVDRQQELIGLLAHSAPRMTAPQQLRAKVLAIAADQPVSNVSTPLGTPSLRSHIVGKPLRFSSQTWGKIAAIAAGLLVLGLGIDNYVLRQKLASVQSEIAQHHASEISLFALKGTKVSNPASGDITLDLEKGEAVIAIRNLPPLPAGQAYYLWAFTHNEKVLCGKFNTNAAGQAVSRIPIPIEEYSSPVLFMQLFKATSTAALSSSQATLVMTSEL